MNNSELTPVSLNNQIINDFTQNVQDSITSFILKYFHGNELLTELPGKIVNVNLNTVLKNMELSDSQIKILSDYINSYQF